MKEYHPMASTIDLQGHTIQLFCQDSVRTINGCIKQFEIWEEYGYQLEKAIVQVIENNTFVGTIEFKKQWVEVT